MLMSYYASLRCILIYMNHDSLSEKECHPEQREGSREILRQKPQNDICVRLQRKPL